MGRMVQKLYPAALLQTDIECIFICEMETEKSYTMLPDGSISIVINLGDPLKDITKSEQVVLPDFFIVGQFSYYQRWRAMGKVKIIIVKFFPHTFTHFFHIRAIELENKCLAMSEVCYDEHYKQMYESIFTTLNTDVVVKKIEQFLIAQKSTYFKQNSYHKICHDSVGILTSIPERTRIKDLANKYDINPRKFERIYDERIGIRPKLFSRIKRIEKTTNFICSVPFEQLSDINLSQLAMDYGFYDQSHFSNEHRTLTGYSPAQAIEMLRLKHLAALR